MIPDFPDSKPLALADRDDVERLTRRFPPSSDFSFGSLWCWDTDGACRLSLLHGNLVVRLADYADGAPHYAFLGDRAVVATATTLLARARAEGLAPRLRLIPEAVVAADERLRSAFAVAADPANFDYVCSVPAWVALSGRGFAKHRARIRRCRERHALAARPLALADPATGAAILALFDRWAAERGEGAIEPDRERAALARLFVPGAAAGMAGWGLYEGDALRAFSIWEYAPGAPYSIHHFMKADRSREGASSLMVHERSRVLLAAGCAFANVEQDLGLPGLAAYKRSLRPTHFLRKFVISDEAIPAECGAAPLPP